MLVAQQDVFENNGCPGSIKVKIRKNLSTSYILTQGHVMSIKRDQTFHELPVIVWLLYHHPNFKYCTLYAGERNYGHTDERPLADLGEGCRGCNPSLVRKFYQKRSFCSISGLHQQPPPFWTEWWIKVVMRGCIPLSKISRSAYEDRHTIQLLDYPRQTFQAGA